MRSERVVPSLWFPLVVRCCCEPNAGRGKPVPDATNQKSENPRSITPATTNAAQITTTTSRMARTMAMGFHGVFCGLRCTWRSSPFACRGEVLPVLLGRFRHGRRCLVQPIRLPLAEIAEHLGAPIRGGEMQVGGFLAHRLEDRLFVAVLGELGKLDSPAMRPKPADHPPILEEIKGIAVPHRALEQAHGKGMVLRPAVCPTPGGRQPRLRLAGGQASIALGNSDIARTPQAPHPGDA